MQCFKLFDNLYRKFPSSYLFWLITWISWFSLLWFLSSRTPEINHGPKIPHFDKVAHFCYFMAGSFVLTNSLHLKKRFEWKTILIIAICMGGLVGIIDEYHQTFTPGRTGNDLGDWIADILGSIAGASYCYYMWKRLTR